MTTQPPAPDLQPQRRRGLVGFLAARRIGRPRANLAIGATLVLFFVVLAIGAPLFAPKDPRAKDLAHAKEPPHFRPPFDLSFGTDLIGRDVLSRVIHGSRTSLLIGLTAVTVALVLGTTLGVTSGYLGGAVDTGLMRLVDLAMAFPAILLAIILVSMLGEGLYQLMLAIGLVAVPQFARLVRAQVLVLKEQEYVEAARALGVRHLRLLARTILPNCVPILMVQATFGMATAILDAGGLSFLGLGVEPERIEWGMMLRDGQKLFYSAPWLLLYPGLALLTLVIGLNLLGDGLRDLLDPRTKRLPR